MTQANTSGQAVVAIELMTFHHEVLTAFCNHTLQLGLQTTVLSPHQGIQKAIGRFAAESFDQLSLMARQLGVAFQIVRTSQLEQAWPHLQQAHALFIGTVPVCKSQKKTLFGTPRQKQSRHQAMLDLIRFALARQKRVYIVIHQPHTDLRTLMKVLDQHECAQISLIFLSEATADIARQLTTVGFRDTLIMPAVGLHHPSNAKDEPGLEQGLRMAVIGEISSRRRDYNSLHRLWRQRWWMQRTKAKVSIIGRVKLETPLQKIGRLFAMPAQALFFIKYPQVLQLWINHTLDLSMAGYTKVSEGCLASAIQKSTCILDLKRSHYNLEGQTTGALGLAMTFGKALVTLEDLESIIPANQQAWNPATLGELLEANRKTVLALRDDYERRFQSQFLHSLQSAS